MDDLLCDLKAQGLHLSVHGDILRVEPRERITDQVRAIIRQHKPALLAALTAKSTAIRCMDCRAHDSLQAEPCGHWWNGRSHHCVSFKARGGRA